MALVNIVNVTVLDNPSPFLRPFQFEITFECAEDLPQGMFPCVTESFVVSGFSMSLYY